MKNSNIEMTVKVDCHSAYSKINKINKSILILQKEIDKLKNIDIKVSVVRVKKKKWWKFWL